MEKGKIHIVGVIGHDTTDLDVIRQVKALGEVDQITVNINSVGGIIEQGFSIYSFLKNHPANIITVGRGVVNSIATVIFQAGNERILDENLSQFVIHNANIDPSVLGQSVDANILQEVSTHLRKEEDKITAFYSGVTSIDFDTMSNLMDKETNLSADEAVSLGFADRTFSDMKAAAQIQIKNIDNTTKMENTNILLKAVDSLKDAVNKLTGFGARNSVEVTAENGDRFYIDMTGEEMTGHNINTIEDGQPTSTPAPDGEHRLNSGKVINVSEGVITSTRDTTEVTTKGEEFKEEEETEIETEVQTNQDQMEKEEMQKIAAEAGAEAARTVMQEMMSKFESKQDDNIKALEEMTASLKNHTTALALPVTQSNTNEQKELSVMEKMKAVTAKVNAGKK